MGEVMKEWPEDNKTVSFDQYANPLVNALRSMFMLVLRSEKRDVPYDGYNIGKEDRACCFDVKYALSAHNLADQEEDQGRTPEETFIEKCLQIGIEQGRRLERKRIKELLTYSDGTPKPDPGPWLDLAWRN